MFARITKFKMKTSSVEEARAMFKSLEPDIMNLPGVLQFSIVMKDDGVGYLIGFVTSEEQARKNAPLVREIWMKFAGFLEAIPTPEGYTVEGCWSFGEVPRVEV